MKYSSRKTTKKPLSSRRKILLLILVPILLFAGGVYAYTQIYDTDNDSEDSTESPAASDDFEADSDRDVGEPLERSGASTDTSSDEDQPENNDTDDRQDNASGISSDSGNITVTSPGNGDNFNSGDTLRGRATVDRVHYRLIDNTVGVVIEGSSRVNEEGRFSAKFDFDSPGNAGRIDVFTIDENGIESDYIFIDVKLWQG